MGGLVCMIFAHLAVAVSGAFLNARNCTWLGWVIAFFLMIFAIIFNATIGPLAGVIISEIPSTRLKVATNAVGRAAYIIMAMINLYFVPKLLEDAPSGWGLGPRTGVVWAGLTCVCWAWSFFRLPETKDRTPAEIDIMFDKKIPVREWGDVVL